MKKKILFAFILNFTLLNICKAQEIELLNTNSKASIRGLSAVNDKIIWASGSKGTVLKTTDGGISWQNVIVKNFEEKDFRDIEAFDSNTAIIMAIAEPAYILKTIDGGKNWLKVFEDSTKGMFLDAMYFSDNKIGIVVGDPINGKAFIAHTFDSGNNWKQTVNAHKLDSGEAFFASSGSNVHLTKNNKFYMVTGGKKSRLISNRFSVNIPIKQGMESTGANSIAIHNDNVIIVGGDFTKDSLTNDNCVLYHLKSKKFSYPKINPSGYRSCVKFINPKTAITCGINGVDISNDGGINWKQISKTGFHIVAKSKNGNTIFFAGSKGRIGKLVVK